MFVTKQNRIEVPCRAAQYMGYDGEYILKKPRKQSTIKEDAGKLLLDIGKLVFGSIFLGGILRGEIPQTLLVIGGITVAAIFCIIGLLLGAKEKKNGENSNSPAKQE